jgi:hypothetical protein
MLAAEGQKLLELRPVSLLRRFPRISEYGSNVEAFAMAVGATGFQLRREGQILHLLLGRDAAVDHGSRHRSEPRLLVDVGGFGPKG